MAFVLHRRQKLGIGRQRGCAVDPHGLVHARNEKDPPDRRDLKNVCEGVGAPVPFTFRDSDRALVHDLDKPGRVTFWRNIHPTLRIDTRHRQECGKSQKVTNVVVDHRHRLVIDHLVAVSTQLPILLDGLNPVVSHCWILPRELGRSITFGYFGDLSPQLGGPVGIPLDLYELSTVRCGDFLGIFLGVSESGLHAFVHEFLSLVE